MHGNIHPTIINNKHGCLGGTRWSRSEAIEASKLRKGVVGRVKGYMLLVLSLTFICGHTAMNLPRLVRSAQTSIAGAREY